MSTLKHQPIMSDDKKRSIHLSVQFMAVMSEMIKIEHMSDCVDAYFKNPMVNNFARRIGSDSRAIQAHLKNSDKVNIAFKDLDFVEEYAAELWNLFHFFIALPLSQIKEVMAGLQNAKIQVEEEEGKSSELFQVIYDTIEYSFVGADLEYQDRSYAIKNATEALVELVKHGIEPVKI